MNTLFLLFTFLSAFLLFNAVLFKDTISFAVEKTALCSYMFVKQGLENAWESHKYETYKARVSNTPNPSRLPKETREPVLKRTKNPLSTKAKWNLSPFLSSLNPSPLLRQATENALRELYQHTSFWKDGLEIALLDSFQKKKENPPKELSQLFPTEPHLQKAFYLMLKGSSHYDLSKKKGYPPLFDFFCLNPDQKKTLYLLQAPYPLLQALFGEDIALNILSLEEDKEPIKKADLLQLFSLHSNQLPMQEIEEIADFSSPHHTIEQLVSQNNQGLSLQMDLQK